MNELNLKTLLMIIIGLLVIYVITLKSCATETVTIKEVVHDTTFVIRHDSIYFEGKAKLRYITEYKTIDISRVDSIIYTKTDSIKTLPFVASLDTIVKQDTFRIAFEYPQAVFSLMLRLKPDSVQYEYKTITVTKTTGLTAKDATLYGIAVYGMGWLCGYYIAKK